MKGIDGISSDLIEMMHNRTMASRCVLCTAFGYKELKKLGYDPKICFGFAAFSVNQERNGIISFGDESTNKYMEDAPNVVHGHYWLKIKDTIIDFSLLFLDQTRDMLDEISSIRTGPILISKKPIVKQNKNKPLIKLQRGAIAHHYNLKKIVKPGDFFNTFSPGPHGITNED